MGVVAVGRDLERRLPCVDAHRALERRGAEHHIAEHDPRAGHVDLDGQIRHALADARDVILERRDFREQIRRRVLLERLVGVERVGVATERLERARAVVMERGVRAEGIGLRVRGERVLVAKSSIASSPCFFSSRPRPPQARPWSARRAPEQPRDARSRSTRQQTTALTASPASCPRASRSQSALARRASRCR